jgi:catechol 2,3-dioxygenase-like lactoylglutathione lyase family enzyme
VAIRTEGLTHIHLIVADLKRSLRFYKEAFGMEEQFWDGPDMVFLRTPGARDTVTLNARPDSRAMEKRGVDHFGFRRAPGQSLDEAIRIVEQAGGRLMERGEHAPGRLYAYVADPDGHVIEL